MKAFVAAIALVGSVGAGSVSADSFGGDACLNDCSGHQAGYQWAQQHDIGDESSCSGNSSSFNEGCRTFIGENSNSSGAADQANDDSDDDGDE
jgi:hypothetical protein